MRHLISLFADYSSVNYIAYIFVYFACRLPSVHLLVYLYYSVDFSIVLLYCIVTQPVTIISFGINKVLSYLILSYLILLPALL